LALEIAKLSMGIVFISNILLIIYLVASLTSYYLETMPPSSNE